MLAIVLLALLCAQFQAAHATFQYFAGYEPLTNVTRHSLIDLDLGDIIKGLGQTCGDTCTLNAACPSSSDKTTGKGCGYDGTTMPFPNGGDCTWSVVNYVGTLTGNCDNAYDIWKNGKHSFKEDAMRNIRKFASGADAKSSGTRTNDVDYKDNDHIKLMNAYWATKGLNQYKWGEEMIEAAFKGTQVGTNTDLDFSTVGRDFRKEAIQKGIVYLNIYQYMIWEMQDQVNDCKAQTLSQNDDASVKAWDEAVAFYSGSLVRGEEYGTSTTGKLQYALADKRCRNFNTCAGKLVLTTPPSGMSTVNQEIYALFNEGKKLARTGTTADCPKLDVLMDKIATLSLIPFVQGTMRYLYKTKDSASAKEAGELWAFASAILPFVHEVDPTAAEKLYKRAWKHDFTSDTYETIKTGIEGTLTNLGAGSGKGLITCESIGDLYTGTTLDSAGCTSPSSSSKNNDTALGLGIGIPLGAIAITALVFVVLLWRKSSANSKRVEELTMQLRGPGKDFYP